MMKLLQLITLILSLSLVTGPRFATPQDTKSKQNDPFVKDPQANADPNAERSIGVLLEYFKLDHMTANQLVSQYSPRATDAQELRDTLQALIEGEKAELYDTCWITARSGNRAKTESVREVIHATKYERAVSPAAVSDSATSGSASKTIKQQGEKETATSDTSNIDLPPLTPTVFDTRNVGVTLELDPILGADNRTIDLNLAPELVIQLEDQQMARKGFETTAKGLEHVWMPTFYTMKTTTQVTIIDGKYCLLGIHSIPDDPKSKMITLLRADVIVVK